MNKILTVLSVVLLFTSCGNKDDFVLRSSIGKDNRVLVVTKSKYWSGQLGKEIRSVLGEAQVGLPQPEPLLTVSQVAPRGFSKLMNISRSIILLEEGEEETINVIHNKYAQPQTIIYIKGKNEERLLHIIKTQGKDLINIIKKSDIKVIQKRFSKDKLDAATFKTLSNLGVSLIIPDKFRTVDDTGEFLWLRNHLRSGIARGAGSNNILVYSFPLGDEATIPENISALRDTIGKKYIPGSREGMYMVTEEAYTPFTIDVKVAGKKAFETRGKWEMKNDFMAGPFVNYTVIDKKNNRIVVVEGFTYSPSVNKREFLFELEAIAKSLKIE